MKVLSALFCLISLALLSGCWEPPYRYDVRGNGQGGIDINHVPKEPDAAPPVPQAAAPPPSAPAPVIAPPETAQQRQVDELNAKIKALSDENAKLKQQLPTTNPGKD